MATSNTEDPLSTLLFSQLDQGPNTTSSANPPTLSIVVGVERLEAHLHMMRNLCSNVDNLVEGDNDVDGSVVLRVPDNLGVSLDAGRMFIKGLYFKSLGTTTLEIWLQVRRLAVYAGCQEVVDKCENLEITSSNCQVIYDNWPEESKTRKRALEMIKKNLTELFEMDPAGLHQSYMEYKIVGGRTENPTPSTSPAIRGKRNRKEEEGAK